MLQEQPKKIMIIISMVKLFETTMTRLLLTTLEIGNTLLRLFQI